MRHDWSWYVGYATNFLLNSRTQYVQIGSINGINAVYFEIEVEDATRGADAKGRMASSTAAADRFATENR